MNFNKIGNLVAFIAQSIALNLDNIFKKGGMQPPFIPIEKSGIKSFNIIKHSGLMRPNCCNNFIFLQWSQNSHKLNIKVELALKCKCLDKWMHMFVEISSMQICCLSTFPSIISTWPSFNNAVFFMTLSFHFCVTRLLLKLQGWPVVLGSLKKKKNEHRGMKFGVDICNHSLALVEDTFGAHLNEVKWWCGSRMVVDVKSYKYQSQK